MKLKNICILLILSLIIFGGISYSKSLNDLLRIYPIFVYRTPEQKPVEIKVNFRYPGDLEKLNKQLISIAFYEEDTKILQLNQPQLKREEWGGDDCYFSLSATQLKANKVEIRYGDNQTQFFDLGKINVQNRSTQPKGGFINITSHQLPFLHSEALEIKVKNYSTEDQVFLNELIYGHLPIFLDQVEIYKAKIKVIREISDLNILLEPQEEVVLRLPLDHDYIIENLGSDFYLDFDPQLTYKVKNQIYTIDNFGGKLRVMFF